MPRPTARVAGTQEPVALQADLASRLRVVQRSLLAVFRAVVPASAIRHQLPPAPRRRRVLPLIQGVRRATHARALAWRTTRRRAGLPAEQRAAGHRAPAHRRPEPWRRDDGRAPWSPGAVPGRPRRARSRIRRRMPSARFRTPVRVLWMHGYGCSQPSSVSRLRRHHCRRTRPPRPACRGLRRVRTPAVPRPAPRVPTALVDQLAARGSDSGNSGHRYRQRREQGTSCCGAGSPSAAASLAACGVRRRDRG